MKKILTIIATAALCSTVATAAHAAPVNFPGSVGSSCVLTLTDGSMGASTGPVSGINTADSGSGAYPANAKVVCNSPSTLNIAIDNSASVANGALAETYFRTTGSSSIPLGLTPPAGTDTLIDSRIYNINGSLLRAATDYKVVADVTLTPN